eukprot:TRINITY_DN30923_c0_g1_i1.p2 TRINITY_DN30923_c0_g1~~TRINITY_DN30923_c0_g1_i1.p2  ORF type:complete len:258 (+),score=14.64 TRINITY_DN30923_c0_g1_i1:205-978(+)
MLLKGQTCFTQRQYTRVNRVSVVARATQSPTGTFQENFIGTSPQDLNNPIHSWASAVKTIRVQDFGEQNGLTAYMRLPPEQYDLLDRSLISYYGGNKFSLRVPRIDIFNLWVEPRIDMEVDVNNDRVLAKAYNCVVDGPPVIQSINSKFCFKLTLKITHVPARELQLQLRNSQYGNNQFGYGQMKGDLRLDVWCENVPPLTIFPDELVQGSVNLALDQGVNTMLNIFLERLGRDSEVWQKSPAYRQERREKAATAIV